MVRGLKNAYLMHFSSLHSWFHCRVCYYLQCSSSISQGVKQRVKKTFFLVKIRFNSCIIINQSQMRPSEKITKRLAVSFVTTSLTTANCYAAPYGRCTGSLFLFPCRGHKSVTDTHNLLTVTTLLNV